MLTLLTVLQLFFSLLLICLVLLQDPKGGAAGGIFGGSGSNSLLGATGATSFLGKLTRVSAISFGLLCLTMTWYLKRDTGSVLDKMEVPASAAPAPKAPEGGATGTATGAAAPAPTEATAPAADANKETAPAPAAGEKAPETK